MTSQRSRDGAKDMAAKDSELHLDPDAEGPGLRDWFDELPEGSNGRAAAFDTRVHASTLVTGQASKGIAKRLRRHGFDTPRRTRELLRRQVESSGAGRGRSGRGVGPHARRASFRLAR